MASKQRPSEAADEGVKDDEHAELTLDWLDGTPPPDAAQSPQSMCPPPRGAADASERPVAPAQQPPSPDRD